MEQTENKQSNAAEIAPGMTSEEIRALYFDATALREPSYRLYQLNTAGYRYYYKFNDSGEPEFFPSVTTLLKQVMPTPPALIDWMVANGKEGATEKRDTAAAYGTFMHMQFEKLIIAKQYDFDAVPAVLLDYLDNEGISRKVFTEWVTKIRKDVLAFAQFLRDYHVQPLAIEIGLVHPEHRFAGCIDMPCIMMDPETGETFPAIVDFKSGRKGFYEEHELQLHLYMSMWNANFPETPVARVFNFSPKDWRKSPSYNLKEQTDSPNAGKIPHLLALASIEDAKRENALTIVHGTFNLAEGDPSDNVITLSLADIIKARKDGKDLPEDIQKEQEPKEPKEPPKRGRKRAANRKTKASKGKPSPEPGKPVEIEIRTGLPGNLKPAAPAPVQMEENLLNAEIEI